MKLYKLLGGLMIVAAIIILVWGNPKGSREDTILLMGGAVLLALAGLFIIQTQPSRIPWVVVLMLFFSSCSSTDIKYRAIHLRNNDRGEFYKVPGTFLVYADPHYKLNDTIVGQSIDGVIGWYVLQSFAK